MTYGQYFQEILHATVLRVNTGDDTFQVREAFCYLKEVRLESWVVHEILHGIQTEDIWSVI